MDMTKYFENVTGLGILATANSEGMINQAIYARPHIIDKKTLTFIMANNRSYKNIQDNPYACYLFKEDGEDYNGTRLYLKKLRETDDQQEIEKMRRKSYKRELTNCHLVYFEIIDQRPLIGNK